jgi:hypothetical protein
MASSPIYTRRMQKALKYEGTDVVTIFKGLQLDIGAPPQFMDFRFTVHDRWHGEFRLDHCGALMDVEPMGEDYVRSMCHDIEDPTFDATAVATHPRAQVRPVHRPPRTPADRQPHCAWTVVIDDGHPPVTESEGCLLVQQSVAAQVELAPIDPQDEGAAEPDREREQGRKQARKRHSAPTPVGGACAKPRQRRATNSHLPPTYGTNGPLVAGPPFPAPFDELVPAPGATSAGASRRIAPINRSRCNRQPFGSRP